MIYNIIIILSDVNMKEWSALYFTCIFFADTACIFGRQITRLSYITWISTDDLVSKENLKFANVEEYLKSYQLVLHLKTLCKY
jgi:hypothetical protein